MSSIDEASMPFYLFFRNWMIPLKNYRREEVISSGLFTQECPCALGLETDLVVSKSTSSRVKSETRMAATNIPFLPFILDS
jgi:hypothetical protein